MLKYLVTASIHARGAVIAALVLLLLVGVWAARTLPMMADRRIVVVLQADRMLNPRRRGAEESDEEPGDVEVLVEYVNSPNPQTTLVLVLGPPEPAQPGRKGHDLLPLNGTARITKALARGAQVVECGQFSSERDVLAWLTARAKDAGLTVDPAAAQQLVDLSQDQPSLTLHRDLTSGDLASERYKTAANNRLAHLRTGFHSH